MLRDHLKHPYLEEAGDPDGGGSTTTQDPPPPPPPTTLSMDEVNSREAQMRRKYERELAKRDKKITNLESSIAELKELVATASATASATPPPPVDTTVEGRIELLEKRWARKEAEMQAQIDSAEARAQEETTNSRKLQRTTLLGTALTEAGVPQKARLAAERYFLPQIEWDELEGKWLYKTKKNNLVPIVEGVLEEMPDMFKPSKMRTGGAGTHPAGSTPLRARQKQELEREEAKLKELYKQGRAHGARNADLRAYTAQKRKVAQMKAALQ